MATPYQFTVTASPGETADMPASYLGEIQPSDLFQATTANTSLDVDLGSALPVDVVAVLFTNLPGDAVWTITAATTQGGLAAGTVIKASGAAQMDGFVRADGRSHGLYHLPATQTFRWWRIDITGGTVPGGKIQIGRLFIGPVMIPTYNMSFNGGYRELSSTSHTQSKSGAVFQHTNVSAREYAAQLAHLTKDEAWVDFYQIQHSAGQGYPVLVSPNLDDTYAQRQLIYGFLSIKEPVVRAHINRYQTAIKIKETI